MTKFWVLLLCVTIAVSQAAAASYCFTDLKFSITVFESNSSLVASGEVEYNVSAGSTPVNNGQSDTMVTVSTPDYYDYNEVTTEKQIVQKVNPFTVHVEVKECGSQCEKGPYVNITAYAVRDLPKSLSDYDEHPGVGNYKFHTKPATWDDARKTCNNEGAHLVVINSEEESKIIQEFFSQIPTITGASNNDFAYIGFHDRFVAGEYISIFDEPLKETGFYRWFRSDQPNNVGGIESCGSVHRNGGLNDLACNLLQPFICEQELC